MLISGSSLRRSLSHREPARASRGVIVVALVLLRALLPWVVLGVIAWWAWKAISK